MSTLFVNNLNTASGSTITIPSGKTLKVTDTPIVGVEMLFNDLTNGSNPLCKYQIVNFFYSNQTNYFNNTKIFFK